MNKSSLYLLISQIYLAGSYLCNNFLDRIGMIFMGFLFVVAMIISLKHVDKLEQYEILKNKVLMNYYSQFTDNLTKSKKHKNEKTK